MMKLYAVTVLISRHMRGASGYVEKHSHALGMQCFARNKMDAARKIEEKVSDLPEAKGCNVDDMIFIEISPSTAIKYAKYLESNKRDETNA